MKSSDERRAKRSTGNRRNTEMDCKEFMRLIPIWLEGKLDGKRGTRFLEHMEGCTDCNEELHIQYLVKEGTARLESGGNFNLDTSARHSQRASSPAFMQKSPSATGRKSSSTATK